MNPFNELGDSIRRLAEAPTEKALFQVGVEEGLTPEELESAILSFPEEKQPILREKLEEYKNLWRKRGA
jgi:hypothetical protein